MLLLVWKAFWGGLGANPVEVITHNTGEWALRFLLIMLIISPLRKWTGLGSWLKFRRMLGLYSFFYGFCHFLVWFIADHSADVSAMIEDVIERPYITFGFLALVIMIPLAVTSNKWMVRVLARRWNQLHKLTYAVVVLGILHYLWLVKADYLEAGIYAVLATGLLSLRYFQSSPRRTVGQST
ncbi:MAG: sulfoxide reductase heme-binding subunit YedZ [Gammaproteobacteria bacterium]|jgi:sulfoxide reductase heme-binding subunit YedZ